MPTIDELAPATAASDTDEILTSQNGTARRVTRAQLLAGVQPSISLPANTLLGRVSTGSGAPETIAVGGLLSLTGGTLVAALPTSATTSLPAGAVPTATDTLAIDQSGTTNSVTYSQLMSGLPNVPNVNASQAVVIASGSTVASKLADLAATVLPKSGGTLTGALSLAGNPTNPNDAANKAYVDAQVSTALPKSGGTVTGTVVLAADPTAPLQPATKQYVDSTASIALPKSGGTLTGPLILATDPTVSSQAATKNYTDTKIARSGDTMTGSLTLSGDPTTSLQAATKNYVDGRIARSGDTMVGALTLAADPTTSLQAATKNYVDAAAAATLPLAGGTLTGALTLSGDPTAASHAATKRYADTRVLRSGDAMTGPLTLPSDPSSALHAATKQYVDAQLTQSAAAFPRTGGALTGPLTLAADPSIPLGAATKQYVDNRVSRAGDTMTGSLTLASDPVSPMTAATKQYVDTQTGLSLPKSGGTLTGPLSLSVAPSVAGHAANKQYVDAQVASNLPLNGGTLTGPLTLVSNPTASAHAASKQYVDTQISTLLPLSGGVLAGGLTLATSPTTNLGAATKQYVDTSTGGRGAINVKAPPYNAQLNGVADDTAAFKAAYVAAAAGSTIFVPNGVAVLQNPDSWGVPLTKRVRWIVDGTTLPDGTSLAAASPTGNGAASLSLPGLVIGNSKVANETSIGHSQSSDFAVNHSSYVVAHGDGTAMQIATNHRVDTVIYNSPGNFIWAGFDRMIWAGTQTPNAARPAEHVGRYIQTVRQEVGTSSSGGPLPQPSLWAACLEYHDFTNKPSSWTGASLVVEMDFMANGPDDGNSRAIQALVIGQGNPAGEPCEVGTVIGVSIMAGMSGSVKTGLGLGVPFSNALIDTTNSHQLSGAAAIRLAAGHSIAFDASGNNYLALDTASSSLRWYQNGLSCPIGKGISVGWQFVVSGNFTLPSYGGGYIVFLVGSGSYTVTLPTAAAMATGVGYTFSALGAATVTIAPAAGDSIDNGPVVLRQHDRFHVVSDGVSYWREVFRTNSVSPRFSGPPVLPNYSVANLPSAVTSGAKAFATNGRKPSESVNAGTGVEVFYDGSKWISVCSGSQVAA